MNIIIIIIVKRGFTTPTGQIFFNRIMKQCFVWVIARLINDDDVKKMHDVYR